MSQGFAQNVFYQKKSVILGHTHTGMGEKVQCLKLSQLLKCPVLDIFDLLHHYYEPLARMNYELAEAGQSILEELSLGISKEVHRHIPSSDLLLILSWSFSVAALLATGIHKRTRAVVKLYAHHPNEKILKSLYDPCDLITTESLLANERAYHYGIEEGKVLYLPHYYPESAEKISSSREYIESLARKEGKKIGRNTLAIGTVARLELGKNCEFAIEAVRQLAIRGKDVILILKGDFPEESVNKVYQSRLAEMLKIYRDEPWFLWDRAYTPFPKVLHQYANFDVLLHPSGAEGASHVVVECLGLKKPVVLLDCSTNPYLFSGIATFVKTTKEMMLHQLPFFIPDLEDLIAKLDGYLPLPDPIKVRERFHKDVVKSRIPLLFEKNSEKIKQLYEHDRKVYGL